MQVKQHWVRLALGVLAALCVVVLYAGCEPGLQEATPPSTLEAAEAQAIGSAWGEYGVLYRGTNTMEELILRADAVARVRFSSVKQTVEQIGFTYPSGTRWNQYTGALEFTFDVLEYLKGSGGMEIKVVAYDGDEWRDTRAEVEALGEDFLTWRDKRWDDREAVVFLRKSDFMPSSLQADRYWLTYLRANYEDGYTVASKWAKAWLPDAAVPGALDPAGGEQRFLLEAPESRSSSAGDNGQTITISALKALIGMLQAEVDAGDGTDDYRECVLRKYQWRRLLQYEKESIDAEGGQFKGEFNEEIGSGLPAGAEVYVGGNYLILNESSRLNEPANSGDLVVTTGQDAGLFAKGWPLTAITARPLPTGEYRFYWAEQSDISALCDAMPEDHRTRNEIVVTVTAPENTLHEAFFDPVTIGTGVGADSSSGVIKPASFTVDGTSTSITGLKWNNGSVVLTLPPNTSLSGQSLDFIELDGSVGLSLEVSSATEDSSAGTLTWAVSDQPWEDGDELMLRISSIPAPSPGVTVTLTPRVVRENVTSLDLDISWVDPNSCDSRYLVGIYDAAGYNIIHFYGFHPAPVTTNYERQTGWSSDYIARQDWLVRVHCALASGEQTLVGEVELRSGLPSAP